MEQELLEAYLLRRQSSHIVRRISNNLLSLLGSLFCLLHCFLLPLV